MSHPDLSQVGNSGQAQVDILELGGAAGEVVLNLELHLFVKCSREIESRSSSLGAILKSSQALSNTRILRHGGPVIVDSAAEPEPDALVFGFQAHSVLPFNLNLLVGAETIHDAPGQRQNHPSGNVSLFPWHPH